MKVIFVVGGLYTEASGVARIVCDLANGMAQVEQPVTVYTAVCNGQEPASHMLQPPNTCIATDGQWMGRLSYAPDLRRTLETDMPEVDVVHQHSIWMLPNHYGSTSARRYGKPVLFTAHGFLEPWALARSRWKKRLVGAWFQDRDLKEARCIHVNSLPEIRSIRDYGLTNPIAVIPNGVDPEPFDRPPDRALFEARFPEVRGKKVALFLSRLHKKKGLAHLIEAWRRVAPDHPDWHLVLVGPDDGFEADARRAVTEYDLQDRVTFAGIQTGPAKIEAYAGADCFLLPSFSEGFSMAVLEGLAAGLPVLITPGCNFPEVARTGAGVEVQPDADGTEAGLRTLFEMTDEERSAMGARGRALVAAEYTWKQVALRLRDVYTWMLGGGPPPSSILLN